MSKSSPLLLAATAATILLWSAAVSLAAPAQMDSHGHDEAATTETVAGHAGDHAETAQGEEHGEGHGGAPHLLTVVALLNNVLPEKPASFLNDFIDPIFSLLVALLIGSYFFGVSRRLDERNPTRNQIFAEIIVGGLYDLFEQVLGNAARRFTPYLGTLFIFILCNNLMGMVPLGHASTSSFTNTTIGLGLCTFLYVQYVGIRENGIGGYLYHFAGQPKTVIEWVFAVMIFPLEVLGELIKPLSLSLRLFGNIFGEDTLIAVMVLLGSSIVFSLTKIPGIPGIPLQFPFYLLGMLASTVQALVFTLLSTIYIALMLPHGHGEEAHGH